MVELIVSGGPMMAPIFLCSILAIAIIFERFIFLQRIKIDTKRFMDDVLGSLTTNRVDEAINICEQSPGPLANVLKAGILKYDRTHQEIKEAIEDAAMHEIPRLEKNIGILATIAQISPLLGLLGTVIGMAEIFQKIQLKSAALNPVTPADLSGGIWQALITTVAGLIVAIPTITAYNYFVNKANNLILEMEINAADLVGILSEKKAE